MLQKYNEETHLPTYLTHNHFSAPEHPQPQHQHISSGLNLIQSIHEENNIFKKQQKYIENQLNRSKSLSDTLLKENIELRKLYKERTRDIGNLVKTISIKTNENVVDYEHKSFLLTEVNCRILKQIKLLMRQKQEIQADIVEKEEEQGRVRHEMLYIEQEIVNKLKAKLKIDLNQQKIEHKLKEEGQEFLVIRKLQQEINQLLTDNKAIHAQLRSHKTQDLHKLSMIQQQRQEWSTRLVYIKQEIKNYKDEINQDQATLERENKQNALKQQKYRQSRNGLLDIIRKCQSKQIQYQQSLSKKASLASKVNTSQRSINALDNQLSQLKQNKKKLEEDIGSVKQRIKTISNNKVVKIDEINIHNKENIMNMQNSMGKNMRSGEEEMMKLRGELKKVEVSIEAQETECSSAEQRIGEYKKVMSQLNNPMGQIQKLQLMIRLKQNRLSNS